MARKPVIVGMDLEGVLVPEIWIAFSKKTGIEKLSLTTRDINDYDELMTMRLKILRENNLKLSDIQAVINTLEPLDGARDFVDWIRSRVPFIILSDTFYEFAAPLMAKLGYPTLFCNSLETDSGNNVINYRLRQDDGKRKAIIGFKNCGFYTIAAGDSYNDTTMLKEANSGVLFHAPDNIREEFPQFPAFDSYDALKSHLEKLMESR
jgi:phosphoserine/homoserine phosphotransferase